MNVINALIEQENCEARPINKKDLVHAIGVSDRTLRLCLTSDYKPKKLGT